MAFSPVFTVSQSAASPAYIVATDSSTGVDAAITQRRIYVTNSAGAYVVPSGTATDYISWPLATNPIQISLLTEDISCNILVQWLDVSNNVLYSTNTNYCLAAFNQQGFYAMTQNLALNPALYQDVTFSKNLSNWWVAIIGAQNAITLAGDLADSQNLLNIATNFLTNNSKYF